MAQSERRNKNAIVSLAFFVVLLLGVGFAVKILFFDKADEVSGEVPDLNVWLYSSSAVPEVERILNTHDSIDSHVYVDESQMKDKFDELYADVPGLVDLAGASSLPFGLYEVELSEISAESLDELKSYFEFIEGVRQVSIGPNLMAVPSESDDNQDVVVSLMPSSSPEFSERAIADVSRVLASSDLALAYTFADNDELVEDVKNNYADSPGMLEMLNASVLPAGVYKIDLSELPADSLFDLKFSLESIKGVSGVHFSPNLMIYPATKPS